MNATQRTIALALALAVIGVAIIYVQSFNPRHASSTAGSAVTVKPPVLPTVNGGGAAVDESNYPLAKELASIDGYINTDTIALSDVVGKKVILIDFWTYSCINCQRTTPYLNAWYKKYKDKGLEIIGVHTPEFQFEHDYANVSAAVKKFNIAYPVVLDNEYATWQAYGNQYWPREYLIDIAGHIVHDHIGEGGYEETEKKIQELLDQRAKTLGVENAVAKDIVHPDAVSAPDASRPPSPETYFGAGRNELLGNGHAGEVGSFSFAAPRTLKNNTLYLSGDWNISREYAQNNSTGAEILYSYQAQRVYFVASADRDVKVKIIKDGASVGEITVRAAKLYEIINDSDYGRHTLKLQIEGAGLKAFTFTFG